MSGDRLDVFVTFDPVKGYVATLPEAGRRLKTTGALGSQMPTVLQRGFPIVRHLTRRDKGYRIGQLESWGRC
jgi:hypothetical protein